MKINLQKIVSAFSCPEDLEYLNYFKQINIYETFEIENVPCNNQYKNSSRNSYNNKQYKNSCITQNNQNMYEEISKIESTIPNLTILSANIIDTPEGKSLEGQVLSGRKLIVVGNLDLSVIITYGCENLCNNNCIQKINIPFSTFIIIPKDICCGDVINIRYLIEDISSVHLQDNKIFVTITMILQYIE